MAKKDQKKPAAENSETKPGPHDYRELVPELPKHFSLVSAQCAPGHDAKQHGSLQKDLELNGMHPVPIKTNYGYESQSFMVPHGGTERDRRTVEMLGWKHGQDSVLHSSNDKHRVVFRHKAGTEERPDWTGEGGVINDQINSHHITLASGKKMQLLVKPPKDDMEKSDPLEKANKLMGSDSSLEGLRQGITKFYYGTKIELKDAGDGTYHVHNSTGKIEGVRVRQHKGRFRFEQSEDVKKSEEAAPDIKTKLVLLKGHMAKVPGSDLVGGMTNPDTHCDACEMASESCSCYSNLSRPSIEREGHGVKILFKSDWSAEDRENFVDDFKARAGRILLRKTVETAKATRDQIRRKLG